MPKDISLSESFVVHRRKFLTTLAAGAGTLALGACGGGGSPSDAAVTGAAASSASGASSASSASSASAAESAAAASGASASSVVDDATAVDATNQEAASPAAANTVNDTAFGVKGDGTTNDRVALQAAIDASVGKVLVITGKSRIDPVGLTLHSNTHLRFASGASIKMLPHNTDSYTMLRIWDASNVVVENAVVDGSKALNSATPLPKSNGWGMGISIAGSSNVTLIAPTTIDCWGDGIYIARSYGDAVTPSRNINVTTHHANGCRRQGVSIIGGSNIVFQRPLWENIGGTLPSAGLDIEPNSNADIIEDIKINNPVTRNCSIGILIYLAELPGPLAKTVTVDIVQHRDESSTSAAFAVEALETNGRSVTGHIASQSPTWVRPKHTPFVTVDYDKAGPAIEVTNPTTVN
jgi:hypothetical protein